MAAMIRSVSSCFEGTRIWRGTERASLEKKPSTKLSQEPCVGVKVNSKRPAGCSASQALGGTCLSVDGSKCRRGVSTNLIHPEYGTVAPSLACAGCQERGRLTRVTCRTFVSDTTGAGE